MSKDTSRVFLWVPDAQTHPTNATRRLRLATSFLACEMMSNSLFLAWSIHDCICHKQHTDKQRPPPEGCDALFSIHEAFHR